MSDIDVGGGVQVAYQNDVGDIKALPELSTMKQLNDGRFSAQGSTTISRKHCMHGPTMRDGRKMLAFKKIEDDGNVATFEYYPEGKGDPGIVSVDRGSGTVSVTKVSLRDKHEWYAEHMFMEARRMLSENELQGSGIIMWY